MSRPQESNSTSSRSPAVRSFAASTPLETLHTAISQDGTLVLEDLLTPEVVARINRELDPAMSGPQQGITGSKQGVGAVVGESPRLNTPLRHSPALATEVVTHPVMLGLVEAILLPHCDTLQLSATHCSELVPGEPAQVLHRDDYSWGHVKGRTHPLTVTTIFALSEFDQHTGGTRVIPGSHQWADAYVASTSREKWRHGVFAELSYPEGVHEELAVQPHMTPGSAVVLLGSTVHGAGANVTTDKRRRGLVIQYCVGWIRSNHNNFLLYPPDFARTLPEPVQRLLGYQLEARHCGQLEQGVDPISLLRD